MIAALALAGLLAVPDPVAVGFTPSHAGFALVAKGQPATIYVDADAEKPVARVAADFASDLQKVSGAAPAVVHDLKGVHGNIVIIGEIGKSALIDGLIRAGKLHAEAVAGQWEAYDQAVVDNPTPGIAKALVIAGSDKRGAVYGTYDISAKMGVSPWYWWADVPVERRRNVYVSAGERHDQPQVKYRGFFINDEDPAFGGWAREKFGGVNHLAYAHVFELLLRLKGDYLWPAMWGKAIADDDPQSLDTADEYGVVLGTSHHEPMTRAQEEWHRHKDQGVTGGAWDYTKNADNLRAFWKGGMERAKTHDYVVTVGMRGDGDEPMSEGTAIPLLQQIVTDQRKIIADVTGKPADQTPQVWALYKEVQDYYDHGMQVPDDITLLFSDDNWGQIRRLPSLTAKPRSGGYGIYYHFDYVGGPRNYKWINTNQIEKVWQQMDLAYAAGARQLWVVNVGDIKPMEYPLSFFLDQAWNPKAMTPDVLKAYPAKWAEQQFGPQHAAEIGEMLTRYSQYAAQRKPELIDAATFAVALDNHDDMHWMRMRLSMLAEQNKALTQALRPSQRPSWFQIAGYEISALDNLYGLYDDVARNHLFASQKDTMANLYAERATADFARDQSLAKDYNTLLDGKWDHMMDQTHIGYTYWQQPDQQVMPTVEAVPGGVPVTHDHYEIWINTDDAAPKGCFTDKNGYVAMEAEHFARKTDGESVHWQVVPNLGRTLSSVIAYPQIAAPSDGHSMRLEYDVSLAHDGDATLNLYLAPTLDTGGKVGLHLAVSVDDQPAQVLSFDLNPNRPDWNEAVKDNIVILKAPFKGLTAGPHTIKVFRIDGNVVLERLVLDTGGLKPSYLGPPESASAP